MAKQPNRQATRKRRTDPGGDARQRHPVEWVAGAASAVLVLSLVVYLAYRGITADEGPPAFRVDVEKIVGRNGRFHVEIAVTNSGGRAAADVTLHARSRPGDDAEPPANVRIDYLPEGSTRRVGFVFNRDPRAGGGLDIAVVSYGEP